MTDAEWFSMFGYHRDYVDPSPAITDVDKYINPQKNMVLYIGVGIAAIFLFKLVMKG